MGGRSALTTGAVFKGAAFQRRLYPPGAGRFRGARRRFRHHELHAGYGQPHPGHRQETPGPAAGRSDADRLPTQHRSVRKSGAASNRGAHSRGQEVWRHPSRDLCRERRERGAAGGDRPGKRERHAAAAGIHRGDPGGAASGAAGQAGIREAEGAGVEGAWPGGAQG